MKKRYMIGGAMLAVLAAAQFVRPARGNMPTDESQTLAAYVGKTSALAAVLDRSCNECHSNSTQWPWYTEIAPLSWLAVSGIKQARQTVNFSEWARYSPEKQRQLLQASCAAASSGKMPGSFYTTLDPRARLSAGDIRVICNASP